MVLSQRLELERIGTLQGSTLIMEPGVMSAAEHTRSSRDAAASSSMVNVSSASLTLDTAETIVLAGASEEATGEEEDGSHAQNRRSRDFQLV